MSIALMTKAWLSGAPSGQKIVLLALCDNANDDGECRPSVAYLARKTSLGESTVRGHIADMEKADILRRQYRTGRSNYYYIHPENFTPQHIENEVPPESGAPQISAPAPSESGGEVQQNLAPAPSESGARTVSEPSKEPSGNRKRKPAPVDDFSPVAILHAHGVNDTTITDWIAHRKQKKAAISETVVAGFVREAARAGITVEAALRYSIESGWVFFRADWYANQTARNATGMPQQGERFSPSAYVNRHRKGDQ